MSIPTFALSSMFGSPIGFRNKPVLIPTGIGGGSYESEVLDWVTRVQGQGSDVSTASKNAVNTFVLSMKSAGIWTKMKRIGVYAGNDLNAVKAPLLNTIGSATDTLTNFVSGDYAESTGLTGTGNPGSLKRLQTGVLITDAALGDNDLHFSVYVRTASNEASVCMGAQNGAAATELMPSNGGISYWDCNNGTTARISAADSLGKGFYLGSRTASNSMVLYKNGVSIASGTNAGGARPATPASLFVHDVGDAGGAHAATSRALSFYSVGVGLTSTEATAFNNAVQALQTAFGRNV